MTLPERRPLPDLLGRRPCGPRRSLVHCRWRSRRAADFRNESKHPRATLMPRISPTRMGRHRGRRRRTRRPGPTNRLCRTLWRTAYLCMLSQPPAQFQRVFWRVSATLASASASRNAHTCWRQGVGEEERRRGGGQGVSHGNTQSYYLVVTLFICCHFCLAQQAPLEGRFLASSSVFVLVQHLHKHTCKITYPKTCRTWY